MTYLIEIASAYLLLALALWGLHRWAGRRRHPDGDMWWRDK